MEKVVLTSISEHSDMLNTGVYMDMSERWQKHRKRVNFGRKKLELWMFVSCKFVDGVWVVLEEPNINDFKSKPFCKTGECKAYFDELKEYQEAKDRVLFEGFEVKKNFEDFNCLYKKGFSQVYSFLVANRTFQIDFPSGATTIEDLVKYNLELTQTAQKEIGLI